MNRIVSAFILLGVFASSSGRVVKVLAGPLIRVEGKNVSISCDVNDYTGPKEQDFEWSVRHNEEYVNLVGTYDPSFTANKYKDRVDRGEIAIKRTSDNSVILEIINVKITDSGEYKCFTPSTDATSSGNYDASVTLNVIPDSLKVSGSKSRSETGSITEGDAFEMRCSVSTIATSSTYLSVSWEVNSGSSVEEIITLTADSSISPEKKYSERYKGGNIRFDFLGNGMYSLFFSRILPSDNGTYSCIAGEWSKEADGTWTKINEKKTQLVTVAVTPIANYLTVSLDEYNIDLSTSDTLALTCHIGGLKKDLGVEVTWFMHPVLTTDMEKAHMVARLSLDGLINGSDSVSLGRLTQNTFQLVVRDLDKTDSGYYFCKVTVWVQQFIGSWHKAAESISAPVIVNITSLEPSFTVSHTVLNNPDLAGAPTKLECKMSNDENVNDATLAVSWYFKENLPGDVPLITYNIASVDHNLVLQASSNYSERVRNGHIVLTKTENTAFQLQILHTRDTDRGEYFCTISTWTQIKNHNWVQTKNVSSSTSLIFWKQDNPKLAVIATPIRAVFSPGETFEMTCKVIGENLKTPRYSVVINVEYAGGKTKKIISLSKDSIINLEEWNDKHRLDSVVLEKTGETAFLFRMYGSQISDVGFYFCSISAWTPDVGNTWTETITGVSNKVKIAFEQSGPSFNVSVSSDNQFVYPGETVKIECVVLLHGAAPGMDKISYDVKWMHKNLQQSEEGHMVTSVDHWGLVQSGQSNSSSDYSLERTDAQKYLLRIHNIESMGHGNYICIVTPWIKSPDGSWQKSSEIVSGPVLITVKLDFWNSVKYPIIYGLSAAAAVGLLSILIGYLSVYCCCKKTMKPNNKTRDLYKNTPMLVPSEMD
ncbi:prostaglandin F2 receptor negative regulator-like [Polypterus senegalus]|uniref:prostaglandin F2 receptor negative regulator-like n=1 Tax=Polypterus senegalus TaxID=55291 RepID=UPI0019625702|nr:prostaglandin F2 receptor negative regulator-like [Polypterus senegalus]